MKEKLVIIGNGMVPGRMLEHLLEKDSDRFDVTIFNAEPRVNYDRIMLSPVLAGEKNFDDIIIHDDQWYLDRNIKLHKGQKVVGIDRESKTVCSDNEVVASYDKLVVATGSMPFILPIPGVELPGVLTYRDLDDVNAMLIAANKGGRAVVIGGGLLGLEAAAGLLEQGMEVTVLHLPEALMERQLDETAGHLLQQQLEQRGINFITQANTKEIIGESAVEKLVLADGREIKADIVVMAVGIKPNSFLGSECELETNRGIVVNSYMETSDPSILSIGECAEYDGQCYGLVAPLYSMAEVAASTLCGQKDRPFVHPAIATKLKVTGVDLYSAGDFSSGEDCEDLILSDPIGGIYKRLILREGSIVGVVLYGDTADGAWYFDLMKKQTDVSAMRDVLVYGQSYQ